MSQAHGLFAGPGRATVAKHSFTEFSVLCLVLFPKKLAPAWPMTSCLCCAFFVPVSGWAFFVLGRALSWPTAKYLLSLILRLICGDVKRLIKYWRGISFGCTGGFMFVWGKDVVLGFVFQCRQWQVVLQCNLSRVNTWLTFEYSIQEWLNGKFLLELAAFGLGFCFRSFVWCKRN